MIANDGYRRKACCAAGAILQGAWGGCSGLAESVAASKAFSIDCTFSRICAGAGADGHHAGAHYAAELLEHLWPNHEIGDAGLVFQRDEHDALGAARALPDEHEARGLEPAAVARLHGFGACDDTARDQVVAQERDRMAAQRQADMTIVLDPLAAGRHRPERDGGLVDLGDRFIVASGGGREERQRLVLQRLDRPEGFAASQRERRPEGVGFGELNERRGGRAGAPPEVIDRDERSVGSGRDDHGGMGIRQAFYHAHAQAHGEAIFVSSGLQRAVPAGGVHADRANLNAMDLGVANDLRWGVEAHGLGVQQRRAEDVGVPALHPGRGVGDQRKRGCVAFRKSVTAEAFELLEGLFGEFLFIAVGDHAGDELVAKSRHAAGKLEGGHALAELVGLARREAGADDRHLHRLLLKQGHAEGRPRPQGRKRS